MGFSRQEYWSGWPFPPPEDPPNPGIEPGFPTLQADSLLLSPPLPLSHQGSPLGRKWTFWEYELDSPRFIAKPGTGSRSAQLPSFTLHGELCRQSAVHLLAAARSSTHGRPALCKRNKTEANKNSTSPCWPSHWLKMFLKLIIKVALYVAYTPDLVVGALHC